jgi:hypothetical protein
MMKTVNLMSPQIYLNQLIRFLLCCNQDIVGEHNNHWHTLPNNLINVKSLSIDIRVP